MLVEGRPVVVDVRASETADVDALGVPPSFSKVLSGPFATTLRLRRNRADCRTLASHLADARAHMRCWERARLTSSLTSESASPRTEAVFSASLSWCFRRFFRQRTMPIMKMMRTMARERDRARIMPVILSELGLPQPLGRVGMVEVDDELVLVPEVDADT